MKGHFFKAIFLMGIVSLAGCSKSEKDSPPVIITSFVDIVTPISAVCSGNISSDGGFASERGVAWSTESMPDISDNKGIAEGNGPGEFSILMTGLTPGTNYFARAYATNGSGTVYGDEIPFTTPADHSGETGTVTDIEGNVYDVIGIGSQFWMKENLRTTQLNDNTAIPLKEDNNEWQSMVAPAYCWYNNNVAEKETYGALYNWYAVVTSKLAPEGWHPSTDNDWLTLEAFLGGISAAGGKLKETGTDHWMTPNTDATNESGFNALPGGYRSTTGDFLGLGQTATFWTSTPAQNQAAWYHAMDYMGGAVTKDNAAVKSGFSVRCVKD